jgi:hypothetical protein
MLTRKIPTGTKAHTDKYPHGDLLTFTILPSNTLLIKHYVHAMKRSSNMQYSTWRHIPEDDTAEDGSDNFLRNVGYEVKFKHAVLLYMASHPRIWT